MLPNTRTVIVASTAFAAMVWLAAPLAAQRGQGGDGGHSRSDRGSERGGRTQPRSEPAPAPAQRQAPPQTNRGPAAVESPRQNRGQTFQQGAGIVGLGTFQQGFQGGCPDVLIRIEKETPRKVA